ncbi:MAG: 3-methyl-2-oxobutanoate hydroxymethyltransferase, partial [Planctomycetota bacterium]
AIADKYVDFLLVGDSLGMVMHGFESTVPVPLDLMIMHGKAVVRGAKRALVVVDMPFGSYEESPPVAFRNAARIMKETDCGAVKLEGGAEQADVISGLVSAGIPVMAHVGLRPQNVHQLGGYRVQRDEDALMHDARAAQEAGAFGIVLECIPRDIASKITAELQIPTIGIGAGNGCDGQVLVVHDLLGMTSGYVPKHVKAYADLHKTVTEAAKSYIADIQTGEFPGEDNSFG